MVRIMVWRRPPALLESKLAWDGCGVAAARAAGVPVRAYVAGVCRGAPRQARPVQQHGRRTATSLAAYGRQAGGSGWGDGIGGRHAGAAQGGSL